MAISFIEAQSNPTHNGNQAGGAAMAVTFSSAVAGDIVYLIGVARTSTGAISVSNAGGQTWTSLSTHQGDTTKMLRVFYCQFNGTWSASPSLIISTGTPPMSVVGFIFRPTSSSYLIGLDATESVGDYSAPGGAPNTVTLTGVTVSNASSVSIFCWSLATSSTFSNTSGSGWVLTQQNNYINLNGSDQNVSFAHKIQTAAGATGNVSKDQSSNTAGSFYKVTIYEYDPNPPVAVMTSPLMVNPLLI